MGRDKEIALYVMGKRKINGERNIGEGILVKIKMKRIKAKKRDICKNYSLQHKEMYKDKEPCKFQEIEKYLNLMATVTEEREVTVCQYGNDKKCVWILFGIKGNEYTALQIGEVSMECAKEEIAADIKAMYSGDEYSFDKLDEDEELFVIDTEFYKNTYASVDVEREKKRKYAYRKMRDDFEKLAFYQLKIDEYLGLSSKENENADSKKVEDELVQMTKSYYAESKLAYHTQARYWNPYYSGVGYEALELFRSQQKS